MIGALSLSAVSSIAVTKPESNQPRSPSRDCMGGGVLIPFATQVDELLQLLISVTGTPIWNALA